VFDETFYTIIGLNIIENKATFSKDETFNITDPYANFVYVSDVGFHMNAGVRLNNHNVYGSHFIYNFNPSFLLKSDRGYTKIFGSYSTSFITPSLSHLYGDFGANPNLKPEENLTIEAGIEYKMNDNFRISGVFFNREEKNTVLWIDGGYLNAADLLNARGVEVELNTTPIEKVSIEANYSFTEYKETLARRIPKHKANVQLGYQVSKTTFTSLSYQYTHERFENSFVPLLDSFSLFNFYISHSAIKNKITFFGGLDNILNEAYEDIPSYATKGRNVRLGFKLTL
jgi:vitamin B12 transporter